MKKSLLIAIGVLLSVTFAHAGVILGYQVGTYSKGLGNIQSTCLYYNKVYNANFNYTNMFHGVYVGLRLEDKHAWYGFAWNNRHNSWVSEYDHPGSGKMKLGIKARLNELTFDGGYKTKYIGFGSGFNIAEFKVLTKRASPVSYDSEEWGMNDYGPPIKLMGLPDYPSFNLNLELYPQRNIIVKMIYNFGIGDVTFSNSGTLMFYDFKPSNLTLAVLIHLGKLDN